ncbi:hypothetical protein ACONUD_04020 [Microbulbifer harenosus]|uniref:DNA replication terminus site-binding protein n=1 Tax=Microbulbifer harenosus TaxID=2576840 RepID=A0ABY2UKI3_9GAMM|nr:MULTISPECIES: hypothetical protein [Microbulbifer]QIL89380.1 hypothetical protein GNX18_06100 [Microbulbifer sp. SH-1]TLM78682.1 hypothetical protein FDY93_05365 [Microbulbifer harenosus]
MPDTAKSISELTRLLPSILADMHKQAAELRDTLEQVQQSARSWESYLLQPAFALEAAQRLAQPFEQPFRLAGALFSLLDYGEGTELGDARQTLQIPGLLAVPRSAIELAQRLNQSKHHFQQVTNTFKACLSDRPPLERDGRLRDALADAGYPRAHLRQCYRQILVCGEKPDGIALSWIKARKSIRRVSAEWCEKKLVQLDPLGEDPGIQYQRQLLAGLHQKQHESLRQVQVQSRPNLQVAEIFHGEPQDHYRQVGYSAMPVLVEGGDNGRLPEFTRVEHTPPASRRRQRRDLKIATEAFLPALRVHLHTDDRLSR